MVRHSVLSRSIGQLEHVVGIRLFERTSGGVRPTPAGLSLLRIARMALEQVDALVEAGQSIRCGAAGRLSIGFCASSIAAGNLRAVIMEFKRRFPKVELMFLERSGTELAKALQGGMVDIVISPASAGVADTATRSLWSERILVALPKDHTLLARGIGSWTDLRHETFLLGRHDDLERKLEDLLVRRFPFPEERPGIERHEVSRGTLTDLTSMGLGISLVLESGVDLKSAGPGYCELEEKGEPGRTNFHAVWRRDNENPALNRFLNLLAERYPSPPADPGG